MPVIKNPDKKGEGIVAGKFLNWLEEKDLQGRLWAEFMALHLPTEQEQAIEGFLVPLRFKDLPSWEHCVRVGILGRQIAKFMHLDQKVLFYAGLLHDVGKAQTDLGTLQKTEGWTPADTREIRKHVIDGYRFLRGIFDFTAEVIKWHQKFQTNGYPSKMPALLHCYCQGTRVMIPFYGRLLALADCFDALHRVNDKHGGAEITGEFIRQKMLELNPDQKVLIGELYEGEVFTTRICVE